ncbi:signal recognition particle-docking protein FtsY [Occultella glacieicola]|uniref:Signal recognition particle receptor FtsY n=1 Tax=Occultella glacieicola TaxID=2518684 RepID=A0ABY2DZW7_9MICO|nr:signal recognition particle-docking protein FtsY [Occultella glacieicola]TDE88265.1 signal recognition particle-docking protein FtsY [Occultella glacieicola]
MLEDIWIYLVLAVVVIGGGAVALFAGRGRKPRDLPPGSGDSGGARSGTATLDTGTDTAAGPVAPPEADTDTTAPPPAVEQESDAPQAAALERPEPAAGRMVRLRERLARSGALGSTLLRLLSRGDISEADWEEIEETLLLADIGAGPTDELMTALRTRVKVLGTTDPEQVRDILREELLTLVDPDMDRRLAASPVVGDDGEPHPATILMVGVNGTGKTTTVGKLARLLVAEDRDVLLGAADTFRAAAADQLATWGERVGVPVVRSDRDGADPAAVAFDAVKAGREAGVDVVLVDTAGRLQNKAGLMDELGKIKRVVARQAPVSEVLLVLDATTGQNGMRQAQVFAEVVDVTGIVLTKLDGTAKGGIVVAVQRELGVPVKFVGLGEGPDDLAPFDPKGFVDALVS